jgi:hypothetical protein
MRAVPALSLKERPLDPSSSRLSLMLLWLR